MLASPGAHQSKQRFESLAVVGQGIVYFWWNYSVDLPVDDPVPLEVSQLLRQHFLGGLRHHPPQLAEAHRAVAEVKENQRLPFSTDHLKSGSHRTLDELHSIF